MFSSGEVSESSSHVDSLRDHQLAVVIPIAVLPLVGTSLVMLGLFLTVGLSPLPNTATLVYGLANVVVCIALFRWLSDEDRRTVFRYRRPTGAELLAAVGLAVVVLGGLDPLVYRVASLVGISGGATVAMIDSPAGAVIVGVTALLIAPVVEEVLFRGYLFGALLARYDGWVAVLGSSAVFGVMHIFLSSLPGVVSAFLIGIGFALIRYLYENLAGVGVSHALINAYYVAAGLGLVPSVVPA